MKSIQKMLPVAAASERRRLITALHAHCALKLSTFAAIAAGAKRLPALARAQVNNFLAQNGAYRRSVAASRPAPSRIFYCFQLRLTRVNNREKGQNAEVKKTARPL